MKYKFNVTLLSTDFGKKVVTVKAETKTSAIDSAYTRLNKKYNTVNANWRFIEAKAILS